MTHLLFHVNELSVALKNSTFLRKDSLKTVIFDPKTQPAIRILGFQSQSKLFVRIIEMLAQEMRSLEVFNEKR